MTGIDSVKKEFGDYQTPVSFAEEVCLLLKSKTDFVPDLILEPTCGVGNFLRAAAEYYPGVSMIGVDINSSSLERAAASLRGLPVRLIHENVFDFDFASDFASLKDGAGRILVLGNPPWVTNSGLSQLMGTNCPRKSNFKGLRGFEAITGKSNFDICEYIILDMLHQLKSKEVLLGMLCKTSVAYTVIQYLYNSGALPLSFVEVVHFDAKEVFGVAVDACLLILMLDAQMRWEGTFKRSFMGGQTLRCSDSRCSESESLSAGFREGRFYTDLRIYDAGIDGDSCVEWRQGLKHDCVKVFELTLEEGGLKNGWGEVVSIEPELVYPLMKSSHVKRYVPGQPFETYVLVTQRSIGEPTDRIACCAPRAWSYLQRYAKLIGSRKSSIYKGSPPFSIFGIGAYSFVPYKVVLSGFYKEPLFRLVHACKPVMVDDTCYFIGFDNFDDAYVAECLLNSSEVRNFLRGIVDLSAKRPYSKKILGRIDFGKLTERLDYGTLKGQERSEQGAVLTEGMYHSFCEKYCRRDFVLNF